MESPGKRASEDRATAYPNILQRGDGEPGTTGSQGVGFSGLLPPPKPILKIKRVNKHENQKYYIKISFYYKKNVFFFL